MKNTEMIMKYLDGELEGEELKWFENELKNDPQLAEKFILHKEVNETLKDTDSIRFRKKLKNIYQTFINSESTTRNANKNEINNISLSIPKYKNTWFLIAASLAVIITTVCIFYMLKPKTYNNEKLFSMYYKPYETDASYRSIRTDFSLFSQGLRIYKQGDFKGALEKFKLLTENDNAFIPANFFSGISFIEEGQIQEAVKSFKFILNQNDNGLIVHAEWYLGLCYLKTNENNKAIDQFQKIVENNLFYQNNAAEILKQIKQ